MGHFTLASPVTNIILFKNLVANLSKILGISAKALGDIVYFRAYVVIDNGLTNLLKKKKILGKKLDLSLINSILQEVIQDKFSPIKEKLNELISQILQEINHLEELESAEKVNKIKEKIATLGKNLEDKFSPIKEKLNELISQILQEINHLEELESAEKVNKIKEKIATLGKKLENIKQDEKSSIEVIAEAEELNRNLVEEKDKN